MPKSRPCCFPRIGSRAPLYRTKVGARRTLHLRFNDLADPEPVSRATGYASIIESTVPIVVQHTRIDSRNPNIGLLSSGVCPQTQAVFPSAANTIALPVMASFSRPRVYSSALAIR